MQFVVKNNYIFIIVVSVRMGAETPSGQGGCVILLNNNKCGQTIPDQWRFQESLVGEIFCQMGDLGAL